MDKNVSFGIYFFLVNLHFLVSNNHIKKYSHKLGEHILDFFFLYRKD